MPFAVIILLRVLFIACMVFILGYVFGSFSRNRTLTVITRIAAIMAIVIFVGTNIFFFRSVRSSDWDRHSQCPFNGADSTVQQR